MRGRCLMMKMLIQLDEEKVLSDEKYALEDMWRIIDKQFAGECDKEVQPDGSVLYSGNPNKDYYTKIMLAYMSLSDKKWFAEYCIKWIWYDNDDNEELPFQNIDVLGKERKRNPLFAIEQ